MMYLSQECISELISMLNNSCVEWLLLRNTEDALPDGLPGGKDVDVLLRFQDRDKMQQCLNEYGCRRIRHPLRDDVRLYGVHPFEMYQTSGGVLLDINFEIVVRSLDRGQWIPLDQFIQASAWENRVALQLAGLSVPMLGDEDLFVTTVARCIFDKKEFSVWHSKKLTALLSGCDEGDILCRLRLIFFKYSDRLLEQIKAGRFEAIVNDYLSFSEY